MKTLSVYASVQEASPTGEHLVHRTITGRLQCPDGPPEARFTALVAAAMAVPDSGLSAGVVARVCAGLAATSWAAAETALPHLDASHVLVHGDLTMHAGTLAPSHQGVRLALPVPGALVTLGAADAPEFTLSLHALPRGSAADEALFFTPFAFLCAPNKVMRLPIENFRAQTPTLMASHAPHRVKRMQAKQQHVQALRSLCLHETGTHTALRVLPDASMVCQTDFLEPESSVVSFHYANL